MNCLICEKRNANQTGSHIIPHFIIKSMVNEDLSGRDKEQALSINMRDVSFSFGRSVLPESLRNTLERNITDQEIQNNEDPFTRDHVFCSRCEKKLSVLESLYADKVLSEVKKGKKLNNSQKRLSYFFWLSVLLRSSVTNFANFKFIKSQEESSKQVINNILGLSPEVTLSNCEEECVMNNMIILANFSSKDGSKNCVLLHPEKKCPYLAIINQFLIVFDYEKKKDIQQLENELNIELTTWSPNKISSGYFDENEREKIIRYCNQLVANQKFLAIKDKFSSKYKDKYSKKTPRQLVQKFLNELIMDDRSGQIDKYSKERINKLIEKYLSDS